MPNFRCPAGAVAAKWSGGRPSAEGRDAARGAGSPRTLPRDFSDTPPARNEASAYWSKIINPPMEREHRLIAKNPRNFGIRSDMEQRKGHGSLIYNENRRGVA